MTKYYYLAGQRVAMRQGSAVSYLYGDHLGSTSLITDASGAAVTETRDPLTRAGQPYGQPYWQWGATRTDYGFTPSGKNTLRVQAGQRLDGFGLMDYNARYYSSTLGRFISPDSIIPQPGSPLAWDRYSYTNNNPINHTDPSGHCVDGLTTILCVAMGVGAVIGGAISVYNLYQNNEQVSAGQFAEAAIGGALGGAVIGGGIVLAGAAAVIGVGAVAGLGAGLACSDGDCTNEVVAAVDATQSVTGQVSTSTVGNTANQAVASINTGTNVVYQYVEQGVVRNYGITNNPARRLSEHMAARGWQIEPIPGLDQLSRFDARAVEQVLIQNVGLNNLYNKINSIASSNPLYQAAVERGTEILKSVQILLQ